MTDEQRQEWAELIQNARLSASIYHECLPHLRADVGLLLAVNAELDRLRQSHARLLEAARAVYDIVWNWPEGGGSIPEPVLLQLRAAIAQAEEEVQRD
jgi:hypothetical protein